MGTKTIGLMKYFKDIEDTRRKYSVQHSIEKIIFMTICSVVCYMNTWQEIEFFCNKRKKWFQKYVDMEYGVPSHDTFERVFKIIDHKKLTECFTEFMKHMTAKKAKQFEVISIDGKFMNGTSSSTNKKINIVSAYSNEIRLIIGGVKVNGKSNEITAIPNLLEIIDIRNKIITIDAIGAQEKIVNLIRAKKGNYLISVKGNQKTFHNEIKDFYNKNISNDFYGIKHTYKQVISKGHGRNEVREYYIINNLNFISNKEKWKDLKSIIYVKRTSETKGETKTGMRYFISNLTNADKIVKAVRWHWGVESMHWSLDISLKEDEFSVKNEQSATNIGFVKRLVLNILKNDKTEKRSNREKRMTAMFDDKYLENLLKSIK